jgi:hypothetical protein
MYNLWSPILVGIAPFIFFFLVLLMSSGRNCPDCGTSLPRLIWPQRKSKRQWFEGGWICPKCGIDIDWKGHKVEMPHAVRWARILMWISVFVVLWGIGIFLIWIMWSL